MGAWGFGIFDEDLACDVRDDYKDYLETGLSVKEAKNKLLKEYREQIYENDSVYSTVYIVIAYIQMKKDALEEEIRQIALEIINEEIGMEIWREAGDEAYLGRKEALAEFKKQLEDYNG